VADLGQELGLGVDFGIAGGQVAADAETLFGDARWRSLRAMLISRPLMQMNASRVMISLAVRPGSAQQGRQDDQGADVEHHHGGHEQPRRAVALLPVVAATSSMLRPARATRA
jgi:hypothetical protein